MAMLSHQQFKADLKHRAVLYFSDEEYLNTREPHYFILICPDFDGRIIFSCCTSKFQTVQRLVEKNRYPESTLVYLPKSDDENPFTKDSYVSCNEYFSYSISELWKLYLAGELSFEGTLPIHSFEQLLIGFIDSPNIEEELKEILPTIDDIE